MTWNQRLFRLTFSSPVTTTNNNTKNMKIKTKEQYEEGLNQFSDLADALGEYEETHHSIEIDYEEIARMWNARGEELVDFIVRSGLLSIDGELITVSNSATEQIGEHMRYLVDCNWTSIEIPLDDLNLD